MAFGAMFRATKLWGCSGMEPKYVVVFLWIVWAVSWLVAANTMPASSVVKAAGFRREFPYRMLQVAGFALLFASLGQASSPVPLPAFRTAVLNFGFAQLWVVSNSVAWGAAFLAGAGFAFAWWGRLHLGGFWSSGVTRKEDHKLIDSGPYALVRHPIYTGLLAGSLALLAISGRTFGVIGFVLVVIALILKARLEERFLASELGVDIYKAYAKRVPMLVPGSPV
jgi:protein-S-isoprenylcysteine O-methyltransferase Ste14